jgi:hypothetical protein
MQQVTRAGLVLVLALAGAGVLGGCGPGGTRAGESPTPRMTDFGSSRYGFDERSTDLDAVTSDVPALAGATAATWYAGRMGKPIENDRFPIGPTDYWTDAVVDLPPGTGLTWQQLYATTPTAETPDVVPPLVDALPTGPFEQSPELSKAMTGTAFLSPSTDQVVVLFRTM